MAYDVKYYFEYQQVDTRIAVGAVWSALPNDYRPALTTTKAGTTVTSVIRTAANPTSPWYLPIQQFATASIATGRTWTTADTFDIAMCGYEDNAALNASMYMVIRILDSTLATERSGSPIYSGNFNTSEVSAVAYSQRHADGVAITSGCTQQSNDRIIVEIGYVCACSTNGYSPRMWFGTNSANDLSLEDNNTVTPANFNPWLAFTYGAPAAASNVVLNII